MDAASVIMSMMLGGGGKSSSDVEMTRTTLYFNNWATTPADTIELVDNYKNYDALEMTLLRLSDSNTRLSPMVVIVPCDAIEAATEMSGITASTVLPYYSTEYIGYTVTNETTLTKFGTYGTVTLSIAKIVGIKYAEEAVNIVSWQNGTDEEIKAMLLAAKMGKIDLNDYWSIGDERTVHLSAMDATGVDESHAEQDVTFVLMDTGENSGYKFADDTPVHFVVGMKDCLNETGYMNSTDTNSGSWEECARRAWCNNVFRAAVPVGLRSIFKQFKTITAKEPHGLDLKTSLDYFALFAEKEISGKVLYGNTVERNALSQIEYYKNQTRRRKKADNNYVRWWERTPYSGDGQSFAVCVRSGDDQSCDSATETPGISPFGCI